MNVINPTHNDIIPKIGTHPKIINNINQIRGIFVPSFSNQKLVLIYQLNSMVNINGIAINMVFYLLGVGNEIRGI